MDDHFLKSIFWTMVALYTVAVIGVWENFLKPVWHFAMVYVSPVLAAVWHLAIKYV